MVEAHRHSGIFIARGKEDALVTKNMVPGESVYGEKRVAVEQEGGDKTEYRVWNPFRSKLAAAVLAGVDNIHIKPGGTKLEWSWLGGWQKGGCIAPPEEAWRAPLTQLFNEIFGDPQGSFFS